jgi:ribonuclease HI
LKCPDWKLWAYTDRSCIGKAGNFIGAGVYCPQTKAECYVNSGGLRTTNTINRAELTGIAAALTNKYTKIATDSACSLSQIRKQLLFPEMQRAHIHSNLLEQIVSIIYASPEPICFYKVKAHSGIAGNEFADAIAKHSALHDGGYDMHFQPPAPDCNAYTHLYWIAAKDTDEDPSGRGAITPRLRALSDIKAKLKTEMCKSRRLGSAKTDTGYYNYWKDLRPLVNKQATIAFWNTSTLKFYKSVM